MTGPVHPTEKKSKTPLIVTLAIIGAVAVAAIGWMVMKNAKTRAELDRIGKLASEESPTGSAEDIAIAIKILESKEAPSEVKGQAAELVEKLKGDGVDEAIISSLSTSPSTYVRLQLSQAAAERGLNEAVAPMLATFRAAGSENQKGNILNLVRRVATEENLPVLLDSLEGSHSVGVRTLFEDIIIAVLRRQPADSAQIREMLARLSSTSGEERRSLFRILCALGTEDVRTRLQTIFNNDSEQSLRLDAITGLGTWPDRSVLPLVKEILTTTDDNAVKILAGRAYARLSALPAAVPITEKVEAWQQGLAHIPRSQDLRRIFAAMAETPAPEVKAVLSGEFRDPGQAALAKTALAQMEKAAETAPTVDAGGLLEAAGATISGDDPQGAFLDQKIGALSSWRSNDTWFVWHFRVKEAGNYGFSVLQSYPREGTSQFEVIVSDQAFPGESVKTSSAADFQAVSLDGSVSLDPDRVHTLILKARGVTQPTMMNIKSIKVEAR